MPGLIDVHVHYFDWMGELYLAHGVERRLAVHRLDAG
jgi:hypothetical protein